jgi:hypothetical protein
LAGVKRIPVGSLASAVDLQALLRFPAAVDRVKNGSLLAVLSAQCRFSNLLFSGRVSEGVALDKKDNATIA